MNEITLDFGTTAQKHTEGDALPVVLLALDQGRYDMARSLDELRALAEANGMEAVAEVVQKRAVPEAATMLGEGKVAEARLVCQNLNAQAGVTDAYPLEIRANFYRTDDPNSADSKRLTSRTLWLSFPDGGDGSEEDAGSLPSIVLKSNSSQEEG